MPLHDVGLDAEHGFADAISERDMIRRIVKRGAELMEAQEQTWMTEEQQTRMAGESHRTEPVDLLDCIMELRSTLVDIRSDLGDLPYRSDTLNSVDLDDMISKINQALEESDSIEKKNQRYIYFRPMERRRMINCIRTFYDCSILMIGLAAHHGMIDKLQAASWWAAFNETINNAENLIPPEER